MNSNEEAGSESANNSNLSNVDLSKITQRVENNSKGINLNQNQCANNFYMFRGRS